MKAGARRAEIEAALDEIVDPCSAAAGQPTGIVTMGLVSSIEIAPTGEHLSSVRVLIQLTEPGCVMGAAFLQRARTRLQSLPFIGDVEVSLARRFDWHPTQSPLLRGERSRAVRASIEARFPQSSLAFLDRVPPE